LLKHICGRSRDEIELITAAHSPGGQARDRTRPIMLPRKAGAESDVTLDTPTPATLQIDADAARDRGESPLRREVSLTNIKLAFEQKWKVEGVVSERVKQKLDKCKSLLSSKYPKGVDYDALFDELTEVFLEKTDPERRMARRRKRNGDSHKTSKMDRKNRKGADRSRRIPQAVKDEVWARYNGRCAYVGTNGKRCNSTHNLQYDHYPIPFARGGKSVAKNLRLLCAKHNRYTGKTIFGKRNYTRQPAASR
jgi:5-methylcytosine-specific restriction endonuclease McrA